MKLLALDTSSRSGSVAITDGERLVGESTVPDAGTHSVWLMGAVDALLTDTRWKISDIELFAVGVGPGSFTGLRIGISVVKGLAWALGRPVRSVSTLKAMASGVEPGELKGGGELICPVLDARKGEIYAAIYRQGPGGLVTVMEEAAMSPEAFGERVLGLSEESGSGGALFLGNGLVPYGDLLTASKTARSLPEDRWQATGAAVARLALAEGPGGPDGMEQTAGELTPLYLRKSEAELRRAASQS